MMIERVLQAHLEAEVERVKKLPASPGVNARRSVQKVQLRFTLKWFLLAIAGVAVYPAICANTLKRAPVVWQREVATIERLGIQGQIEVTTHVPWWTAPWVSTADSRYFARVTTVDLSEHSVPLDTLAALGAFPELETLNLRNSQDLTPQHFACVGRLKNLCTLHLSDCPIEDSGLVALLTNLSQSTSLSIANTSVGDSAIIEALPKLRLLSLDLQYTRVTDRAIEAISHRKSLRVLYLGGAQITDSSVPFLLQLPFLTTLEIARTNITAEGLRGLCNATHPLSILVNEEDLTASELNAVIEHAKSSAVTIVAH